MVPRRTWQRRCQGRGIERPQENSRAIHHYRGLDRKSLTHWSSFGSVCCRTPWNIFIGPESDHWLCLSLTDWLTHSLTNSLLFSKLDWCDPGMWRWQLKTCCYCLAMLVNHWLTDWLTYWLLFSRLDDEDRVCNRLLQIWELRYGHKAKLLFRLWAQGLVKTLKLKFRQDLYGEKDFLRWKKSW